jgi:hypothetical protein
VQTRLDMGPARTGGTWVSAHSSTPARRDGHARVPQSYAGWLPGRQRQSVVGAWSVKPRHAVVFHSVRWPNIASSEALRRLGHGGSEALLKPVSQVRILPGALMFSQFSDGFRAFAYASGSFWSVRGSVTVWHQMTHLGWRWSLVPRR